MRPEVRTFRRRRAALPRMPKGTNLTVRSPIIGRMPAGTKLQIGGGACELEPHRLRARIVQLGPGELGGFSYWGNLLLKGAAEFQALNPDFAEPPIEG
jgi:hypothetical protein